MNVKRRKELRAITKELDAYYEDLESIRNKIKEDYKDRDTLEKQADESMMAEVIDNIGKACEYLDDAIYFVERAIDC